MNAIQLQIRNDINYLARSWKTPKIYPVNGDISKEKSFDKKPALLSFLKPEESDTGKNGGKQQIWVVELFLVYSKLPEGADPANKSAEFDTQSSEMIEVLDKLHSGLTKQYIDGAKNPIAHSRGYEKKSSVTFLDTYFEFGANKYMAVRATFKMLVPVPACFDCTDFVSGTFEAINVPPNDANTIGGANGTKGDILYWNDTVGKWVRLHTGSNGQVLELVAGIPAWVDKGRIVNLKLTVADFDGQNYQNDLLKGLVPDIGFFLSADNGTGGLMKVDDGYSFNATTGTITELFTVGNYRLQIFLL